MAEAMNCQSCCRLCLSENMETLHPVFGEKTDDIDLTKRIFQHLSIDITPFDRMSKMVCQECEEKITNWDSYKDQCIQNQKKFDDFTLALSPACPDKTVAGDNENDGYIASEGYNGNNEDNENAEDKENNETPTIANFSFQIKEEPADTDPADETPAKFIGEQQQTEQDEPIPEHVDIPDLNHIIVKSEPIDMDLNEEMEQEYHEFPPTLSPHNPLENHNDSHLYGPLVPEKSKERYDLSYSKFKEWCGTKNLYTLNETALMNYFFERSEKLKSPSSLWCEYSMLKTTLSINDDVDISRFLKLRSFLKKKNAGYKPKKAKVFSRMEINRFLTEAPDDKYLMMKVVTIIGVSGACSKEELIRMTVNDIQDKKDVIIINIQSAKNKTHRTFAIVDSEDIHFLDKFRQYRDLRSKIVDQIRFFLRYERGKCINQVVGKNTLAKVPFLIAQYLNLENPEGYTGHSFRKTTASLLADTLGL